MNNKSKPVQYTCKRCHATVEQDQCELTIYRGYPHRICHDCLAEMEKVRKEAAQEPIRP